MKPEEYEKMYSFEENNWWYKGRRELLLDVISKIEETYGKGALRILDVGCGTGINLKSLERYGDADGLDISSDALRLSRSRGGLSLIGACGELLPFRDESFNMVCALDVLEHIEDDARALGELKRVLIDGGYLVVAVPAFMFLWSGHDRAVHHKRRYSKGGLMEILRNSGLEVIRATYWNCFLFPGVMLFRALVRDRFDDTDESTDLRELPAFINGALLAILRMEKSLIRYGLALPIGVSIMCVCRKGSGEEKNAFSEEK